jgi:hypothetical protein
MTGEACIENDVKALTNYAELGNALTNRSAPPNLGDQPLHDPP